MVKNWSANKTQFHPRDLISFFIAFTFLLLPLIQHTFLFFNTNIIWRCSEKYVRSVPCKYVLFESKPMARWSAEILLNEDDRTGFGFLQLNTKWPNVTHHPCLFRAWSSRPVFCVFCSRDEGPITLRKNFPAMRILSLYLKTISLLASTALWVISFTSFNFLSSQSGNSRFVKTSLIL